MTSWLEKYRPTELSEVIGNQKTIGQINTFLQQFATDEFDPATVKFPNIIISGANGIGKTLIVDIALGQHNFERADIDLTSISTTRKKKGEEGKKKTADGIASKNIAAIYKNTIGSYAMDNSGQFVRKNGKYVRRRVAIVFDDVSNISTAREKDAIKSLIKLNNKQKMLPIIIITNNKHSKNVKEIKKMLKYSIKEEKTLADNEKKGKKLYTTTKIDSTIIMQQPDYNDMELLIKRICKNERLILISNKSDEYDIYEEIIKHSQYDIRRMINILEQLKLIYENNQITYKDFESYIEISKKKDQDPGIYQASFDLLNKYNGIDYVISVYDKERSAIPLMLHENYMLNIQAQYPKMKLSDQIDILDRISRSISFSDMVDGLIFSKQSWQLQSVHGHYSCVVPSFEATQTKGSINVLVSHKYTRDFNRTSTKKINNKAIKNARKNPLMKRYSVEDFMYMSAILKELVKNKNFEEIARRMKEYKLKWKEIESIIKIDKIKKNIDPEKEKQTSILGCKEKKIMLDLLDVDE